MFRKQQELQQQKQQQQHQLSMNCMPPFWNNNNNNNYYKVLPLNRTIQPTSPLDINVATTTDRFSIHQQPSPSADFSQNSSDFSQNSSLVNALARQAFYATCFSHNAGGRNLTAQGKLDVQAHQHQNGTINPPFSAERPSPSPCNLERLFEQALRNLPIESTTAYLQAREQQNGLALVSRESPFRHFLQREDNDVLAGAMRMAEYWTRRKDIFGAERAFKPLDVLNGSGGALSRNDIDLMASCFFVPITEIALSSPSSTQQLAGQQPIVFSFDRSRAAGVSTATLLATMMRSLFYWSYVVKDHESTRTKGITCIAIINTIGGTMGRMDPKAALDVIQDALPIKIKDIHICLMRSSDANNSNAIALAVPGSPQAANEVLGLKQRVLPLIRKRFKLSGSIDYHIHFDRIPNAPDLGIGSPLSCEGFLVWFQNKCSSGGIGGRKLDLSSSTSLENADGFPIVVAPPSVAPVSTLLSPLADALSPAMLSGMTASTLPLSFAENVSLRERALLALEEAIDIMTDIEKAAYMSAKKHAPYLVQTESDPMRFLRFAKYDTWAAARKLVKYWSIRVEIFGSRAFLPLTISGDGAMTPEDIHLMIDSGYLTHMPPDADGRYFVVCDMTKRRTECAVIRMRAAFYNFSVVCENERSATEGWTAILIVDASSTRPKFDNTLVNVLDLINALPTFAHKVHVVKTPTGFGERMFLELLMPFVNAIFGRLWGGNYTVNVGTREQLVQKLAGYSITQDMLPDVLGGPWTMEHHRMWMRERVRIENARYNRMYELQSLRAIEDIRTKEMVRKTPMTEATGPPAKKMKAESFNYVSPSKCENQNVPFCETRRVDLTDKESLDNLRKALDEAMESLPAGSKTAYQQALAEAPELIKKESNPESFLRFARFDATVAAKKLAKYWEIRRQLFGSQAFSPIDQTGEGGLDRRDLAVLGSAFLMCLPKDGSGRSVVFCDGIRLTKSTKQSRQRVSFYMFSIAAEAMITQNDGFVLIHVCTEPSFDKANKECLDLILSAIPAHIADVYLLKSAQNADERFSGKIDPTILQHFQQLAQNKVTTHVAGTRPQLSQKLKVHGLDPENLPKSIGGGFGYARFVQWQELRTRWEWGLPPGNKLCEENAEYDFSGIIPLSKLNEEERAERKRRQNIIHSRRQRERERIEMILLDEECEELTDENKDLNNEFACLTKLLCKANDIIKALGN